MTVVVTGFRNQGQELVVKFYYYFLLEEYFFTQYLLAQ